MKLLDKVKEILEISLCGKKISLSRYEFSLLAYEYRGLEMYIRNSAYQHIIEVSNGEIQKNVLAQVPMTKYILVENWKQTDKENITEYTYYNCPSFTSVDIKFFKKIKIKREEMITIENNYPNIIWYKNGKEVVLTIEFDRFGRTSLVKGANIKILKAGERCWDK